MNNSVNELATMLERMQQEIRDLQRQPQLAYSSIEDGAVNEYDLDGQLSSTIGKQ